MYNYVCIDVCLKRIKVIVICYWAIYSIYYILDCEKTAEIIKLLLYNNAYFIKKFTL